MSNAILLCSGVGRRMAPIKGCVKGFLPIRGEKSNIHRILRILHESGINEVVIAIHPDYVDALSELLKDFRYPNMYVSYISVTDYEPGCNNSVTMRAVSDYIGDTYVIECDQYYDEEICKSQIFKEKPVATTFFTQIRSSEDDWCVMNRDSGTVTEIMHSNPTLEGYCLSGIIYLSNSEGSLRIFKDSLTNLSSDSYWEDAIDTEELLCFNKRLDTYATEFDDISDLISNNLMSPIDIASRISEDIVQPVGGMTNTNFLIKYDGRYKVLRLPGYGTEYFIDHNRERLVENYVHNSDPSINPLSTYYCQNSSVKMTDYLDGYRVMNSLNDFRLVVERLYRIHQLEVPISGSDLYKKINLDLREEIKQYEEVAVDINLPKYYKTRSQIYRCIDRSTEECIVHRDLVPLNIMLDDEGDVKFIDWEYSGILDKYWDIAALCCEYSDEYNCDLLRVILEVVKWYPENLELELIYKWIAVVDFVWSVWSLAKVKLGDDVLEYGIRRYNRCLSIISQYY